jgi:hypothetical protein
MLKFALALAAMMIAVMPAALGLFSNASFIPETPVRAPEQSEPLEPQPMRPTPGVDDRKSDRQDRESPRSGPGQAHNEGDDRAARASRPTS